MTTDNPSPGEPKPAKIQRFKIGVNVVIQVLTLLVILLMVNYLSFNHYRRWDYTRTHRYSLSEKTKRVLAGLKKPVKIIIFFSSAAEIAPDVTNLLKEYQYASNKISVENIDANRNFSRASELQNKYKFGADENVVILDCDGRKKFVKAADMVDIDTSGEMYGQPPQLKDFKGEQALTGALLQVTDEKPATLYAITGQGERDLGSEDFNGVKLFIERENVKVQPLTLQDVIPSDAGILFILGAKYDFSEQEINLLRDYWEKKGRLFVLLDPAAQAQTPRLDAFLAEVGIKPEDDRILRVTQTHIAAIAGLMRDVTGAFVEGSPVTKNLKGATGIFLGETQSLTLNQPKVQAAGIHLQMLVQASTGYWGEINYNLHDGDPVPYFDPKKDFGQPLAVVASVEKGAVNDSHVQVDSSRMIVAGNCEFISNKTISEANANLDFAINAIDWLLDREELIGIAPKANKTFSLNLTDSQVSGILFVTMGLIPGAVAVFGFALWWKRRH